MPITIVHDGSSFPEPAENCCFCFGLTRHWPRRSDVAVGEQCAPVRKVKEIPTKQDWLASVRARTPRRVGEIDMAYIKRIAS
ncbi:hypothetical protein [Bradyrhizobium elkanii]|uniref:hypothetical protein n=1 Tax=Bradyrhizobium elkanii TaxID=29448 RepID=UPI003515A4A3